MRFLTIDAKKLGRETLMYPFYVLHTIFSEKSFSVLCIGKNIIMSKSQGKHPVFNTAMFKPEDRSAALLSEISY